MILSIFSKLFGGNKDKNSGGKQGGAGRADAFIQTLKTELNLSIEQETKIHAALQEFFQEKKTAKQGGGDKSGLRESKQDFKQDIINALNPDQQKKFMDNIQVYKQLLKR